MKRIWINEIDYTKVWRAIEDKFLPKYKGYRGSRVSALNNGDIEGFMEIVDLKDSGKLDEFSQYLYDYSSIPVNYIMSYGELISHIHILEKASKQLNLNIYDEEIKFLREELRSYNDETIQILRIPFY